MAGGRSLVAARLCGRDVALVVYGRVVDLATHLAALVLQSLLMTAEMNDVDRGKNVRSMESGPRG